MNARSFSLLLFTGLVVFSCQKKELPLAFAAITAEVETEPVRLAVGEDAADDPSIWVHPGDASKSLIFGTVKGFGIESYDLKGNRVHGYPIGNPNNIDVAYKFLFQDGTARDIVGCSEREKNVIRLFAIDSVSGHLTSIESAPLKSSVDEIYGFCFYRSRSTGMLYAFANGKNGVVEQWLLQPENGNSISGKVVRKLRVNTQPEGMVADEALGLLYVGEEDRGVWRFEAEPGKATSGTLLPKSGQDNPNIAYDVEGLCIFPTSDSSGYLLVSSQGNYSYAVFEKLPPNRYLGSFVVADGQEIDGSGETDGIDVCPRNLGGPFAGGIFVVQDGENTHANGKPAPQNFKYVAWKSIQRVIDGFAPNQSAI